MSEVLRRNTILTVFMSDASLPSVIIRHEGVVDFTLADGVLEIIQELPEGRIRSYFFRENITHFRLQEYAHGEGQTDQVPTSSEHEGSETSTSVRS